MHILDLLPSGTTSSLPYRLHQRLRRVDIRFRGCIAQMHILDLLPSGTTSLLPYRLQQPLRRVDISIRGCIAQLHLPDLLPSGTTSLLPYRLQQHLRRMSNYFRGCIESSESRRPASVRVGDSLRKLLLAEGGSASEAGVDSLSTGSDHDK